MEKPIKNRGILKKILVILVAIIVIATGCACLSSCSDVSEDGLCKVKFDDKNAVFTLPQDVTIRVDKRVKNYVYERVAPKKVKEKGGLLQYTFETGDDTGNRIFRLEKEGCVTRSGYFVKTGEFVFNINDNTNVFAREDYQGTFPRGVAGVDDIMLTNVGGNYYKKLEVGEKFELRAFRSTGIIDSPTNNLEIQPDFEVEILTGDNLTITQQKENVFDIRATKQGKTIIKLKYRAVEVLSKGDWFCYNASDERREAVITFAVGEIFDQPICPSVNGVLFDSEFDTVYFTNDYTSVQLDTNDADYIVCNDKKYEAVLGKCTFEIVEGANFIEIVRGEKSCFMTIYGAKISVKIDKIDGDITIGDELQIRVSGLYTALPKMTGIYNPTQNYVTGGTPTVGSRLQFIMANGETLNAEYQSQYYSGANCAINILVKEEYLDNGKLSFDLAFRYEWWGSDLGVHRYISGNGVPDNLNAEKHYKNIGIFEDKIYRQ